MGWEHRWFIPVSDPDAVVGKLRHKAGIDADVEVEHRTDRYYFAGPDVGLKARSAEIAQRSLEATDELELKWRTDSDGGAEKLRKKAFLKRQFTRDILTAALSAAPLVSGVLTSLSGTAPASILVQKERMKDRVFVQNDMYSGILSYEVTICQLQNDPVSRLRMSEHAETPTFTKMAVGPIAPTGHSTSPETPSALKAKAGQPAGPPLTWVTVCVEGCKDPGVLSSAGLELCRSLPPSVSARGVYVGGYSGWMHNCIAPLMVQASGQGGHSAYVAAQPGVPSSPQASSNSTGGAAAAWATSPGHSGAGAAAWVANSRSPGPASTPVKAVGTISLTSPQSPSGQYHQYQQYQQHGQGTAGHTAGQGQGTAGHTAGQGQGQGHGHASPPGQQHAAHHVISPGRQVAWSAVASGTAGPHMTSPGGGQLLPSSSSASASGGAGMGGRSPVGTMSGAAGPGLIRSPGIGAGVGQSPGRLTPARSPVSGGGIASGGHRRSVRSASASSSRRSSISGGGQDTAAGQGQGGHDTIVVSLEDRFTGIAVGGTSTQRSYFPVQPSPGVHSTGLGQGQGQGSDSVRPSGTGTVTSRPTLPPVVSPPRMSGSHGHTGGLGSATSPALGHGLSPLPGLSPAHGLGLAMGGHYSSNTVVSSSNAVSGPASVGSVVRNSVGHGTGHSVGHHSSNSGALSGTGTGLGGFTGGGHSIGHASGTGGGGSGFYSNSSGGSSNTGGNGARTVSVHDAHRTVADFRTAPRDEWEPAVPGQYSVGKTGSGAGGGGGHGWGQHRASSGRREPSPAPGWVHSSGDHRSPKDQRDRLGSGSASGTGSIGPNSNRDWSPRSVRSTGSTNTGYSRASVPLSLPRMPTGQGQGQGQGQASGSISSYGEGQHEREDRSTRGASSASSTSSSAANQAGRVQATRTPPRSSALQSAAASALMTVGQLGPGPGLPLSVPRAGTSTPGSGSPYHGRSPIQSEASSPRDGDITGAGHGQGLGQGYRSSVLPVGQGRGWALPGQANRPVYSEATVTKDASGLVLKLKVHQ